MKKIWVYLGRISYVLAYPALYFYLKDSQRSRILVRAEGKILVIQDWLGDGSWKLPGGGVHDNEEIVESARRELLEETGIEIMSSQLKHLGEIKTSSHYVSLTLWVFGLELPKIIAVKRRQLEVINSDWKSPAELLESVKLSNNTRTIIKNYASL